MNFIKKYIFLVLTLALATSVFGQKIPPANWSHAVNKTEIKAGDVIEVIFKTQIPAGYHIYSNDYGDCPPRKAEFTYETHASYELVGKAKAIGSHHYEDDIFECEVADFEKKAEFRQKIKILSANPKIEGLLEYQMCTADGMCVLFEYEIEVKGLKVSGASTTTPIVEPDTPKDPKDDESPSDASIDVDEASVQSMPSFTDGNCTTCDSLVLSQLAKLNDDAASGGATKYGDVIKAEDVNYSSYQAASATDIGSCETKTFDGETNEENQTYWGLFILAFLSGLVALLTPCVFPMIPMTVSFFMKDGSKAKAIRDGIIYGLSIIAIYVVIGAMIGLFAKDASFANWLSTHWVPNVFFFLIFVVFAASFFGAFELTLPSWVVNKADKQADKGGFIGIFFMAFTIALVSFSCTGPIVGGLLVQSVGGAFIKPVVGMFGFSLAFALPFTLFAIFPNWLNGLPKSGGWLNSVKVVLGFLELALGLKFLSIADQTYHWGLLDREIYIGLWIVIFLLMGFYLLGKIKFSHDSDMPFLKVPRLMFAIATFSFVVYLVPGLIGAPLKALAGYLPPMSTHDFNIVQKILNPNEITQGYGGVQPKYNDKLHLPDGLRGYFDYEQGMEVARSLGKPVFIDFTGHGCVNCREMEARVWTDSRVHKFLDEDYVVVALYADEKTIALPKEDQFYAKNGKLITRLDKKNSWIQECYFNRNAQPQYALLDNEGNLLQPTRNYDLNKDTYVKFLKDGLVEYKIRMDAKLAE
ncbi:MAG: disulfide bond formation protein DsbD [Bacteroidetes bacterium]|nr:MAG: disulfide bond formation protein DsbD [Bacteroidota bacterium]